MKKLHILFFALCLLQITQNSFSDQHILLRSPIIEFIDGKSIGINESVINLMLQVRGQIKKILFGKKLANGHFEGPFNFEGHMCSVRMLSTLEAKYEHEYQQKKVEFANDKKKLDEAHQSHKELKQKLNALFETAKKEFKSKVTPFAKNARGAKEQMIMLISESCTKRSRPDSLLLRWADTDEHTEMKFFDEQVMSFKELDQFCIDLANFLGDLMHSCPKAMAQYEKAKKAWDEQHK